MGMFSILPASLAVLETWVARIFFFFALLIIGPWLLLLVYDLFLYIFRTATYEIPIIGGRARRQPRPRAPSLTAPRLTRPDGHRRHISLPVVTQLGSRFDEKDADGSSTGRLRSSSNVTSRQSSKSQDESS